MIELTSPSQALVYCSFRINNALFGYPLVHDL